MKYVLVLATALLAGCSAEVKRVTTIESDPTAQIAANAANVQVTSVLLIVVCVCVVALIVSVTIETYTNRRNRP